MKLRTLLLSNIILDHVLAMAFHGSYWRVGLYIRPAYIVVANRQIQNTLKLLGMSLIKARQILTMFVLLVWIAAIILMVCFMHESSFEEIGITGNCSPYSPAISIGLHDGVPKYAGRLAAVVH